MTEDVLKHLQAMKAKLAEVLEVVNKFLAQCEKQSERMEQIEDTLVVQANKIKDLEVEVQILKDGGNI